MTPQPKTKTDTTEADARHERNQRYLGRSDDESLLDDDTVARQQKRDREAYERYLNGEELDPRL